MGLKQHVDFPTHRDGNLLDLIIMDDLMKDNIVSCSRGDLVSDHYVIFGELLWEPSQKHTRKRLCESSEIPIFRLSVMILSVT